MLFFVKKFYFLKINSLCKIAPSTKKRYATHKNCINFDCIVIFAPFIRNIKYFQLKIIHVQYEEPEIFLNYNMLNMCKQFCNFLKSFKHKLQKSQLLDFNEDFDINSRINLILGRGLRRISFSH